MRGTVVAWVPQGGSLAEHERVALSGIAGRIARLMGYEALELGEARRARKTSRRRRVRRLARVQTIAGDHQLPEATTMLSNCSSES